MPGFPVPPPQAQTFPQLQHRTITEPMVEAYLNSLPPVVVAAEETILRRFIDVASLPGRVTFRYMDAPEDDHAIIRLRGSASLGTCESTTLVGNGMNRTYESRDCILRANTRILPSIDFSYTMGPL